MASSHVLWPTRSSGAARTRGRGGRIWLPVGRARPLYVRRPVYISPAGMRPSEQSEQSLAAHAVLHLPTDGVTPQFPLSAPLTR